MIISLKESIQILKRIRVTSFDTNNIYDNVEIVNLSIKTLITAYQKEKEKNEEYYKRIVELINETGDLKQEIESLNNKIDMQKDSIQDMKEQYQEEFENRNRWD